MGFLRLILHIPIVRALYRRHLLFPTIVLIVVAAVLLEGALDRAQPGPEGGDATAAEAILAPEPRPIIRADLEKTPLTYFSDYWSQLAEGARDNLVAIGPSGTPGILVGPQLALTTVDPALQLLAERDRVELTSVTVDPVAGSVPRPEAGGASGQGQEMPASESGDVTGPDPPRPSPDLHRLRAWDADIGLSLFDVADAGDTAFTLSDPRSLPSGSYVGAVSLGQNGQATVIPGHLVSVVPSDNGAEEGNLLVSMDLPPTVSIAAVLNLDGAMVGLAFATPKGTRVVTTTAMLGLIERLQADGVCRSIEVSDLSQDVRNHLGLESGVLVEYVQADAFAPEPSLQPGDILLEWGDTPLLSTEQFEGLYDTQVSGSLVRYRVLRGRRRVTGGTRMPPRDCGVMASDPVRLPRFGLAVQWRPASESVDGVQPARVDDQGEVPEGWYVVAVAPEGPSAAAGVREGDRLVTLGGESVADEQDRPILEDVAESDDTLLLSLRRGGRAQLVAVSPLLDSADIRLPIDPVRADRQAVR